MNEPQKQAIMAELVVAVLTNHNKLSGLNNHYLFNAQLNGRHFRLGSAGQNF